MIARHPGGPNAAAAKYDLLTLLGVVGLASTPVLQRSMLRLITLVTARYNWRAGEMTVGRREIARLWGVDERTVKREMARLKALGFVVLKRPGVRGRVAAYAVDFDAALAACDCARVGPDFVARMTGAQDAPETGGAGEGASATVIPFPQPDPEPASEWAVAKRALKALGAAAHQRWIAPLTREGRDGARLTLRAPSAYHAAYVERTYGDAIAAAVAAADPALRTVRIVAPGATP
jgi:hypothetical protein